ncbi:MAG: MmgE/PrpD family protein [Thaumarchaeota archaeon]|nr:MmgE/PrpD family protein [Nitrososphaerota archaeon]
MTLAARLARYVLSLRYSDLDAGTVRATKVRVIDALGCAIGACGAPPVAEARRAVAYMSPKGPSTILGTASSASPDLAAFVNGLMIRYFDFNDTYLSKEPAHPSDNLGAVFAVAESERASGKELIAAAVAAYEVQCRLCDAADIRHRGWDHVNYGLVSTPLASAKLMGLELGKATQAVNIALNSHIAMRQVRAGDLSMWKGASFANAARNGVFAALLAREGFTGPAPIFEGEMGFFKQVSGPFRLDVSRFGGGRVPYRVNDTYIKFWPAEYHAQTAIWAALELRKKVEDIGSIASVLVQTHEAGYTILAGREKWKPKTKETADHSLPYIVGMALAKGIIDNSTYSEKNLGDPRNLGMVKKVRVKEDRRLTAMYPLGGMPNRVTIGFVGGGSASAEVAVPRGHPKNPMSVREVESKFMGLTRRQLGEDRAREALKSLWQLESAADIGRVLGLLDVREARSKP